MVIVKLDIVRPTWACTAFFTSERRYTPFAPVPFVESFALR